jgi:hypothetical protein
MKTICKSLILSVSVVLALVSSGFAFSDEDGDGREFPIGRTNSFVSSARLDGSASILVDRTHGGYPPMSGFLSDLVTRGWTVTEVFDGPITLDLLLQYDILLDCKSYTEWSADELADVQAFVSVGGGLWALGDIYSSMNGTNSLSEVFGVHFNPDDRIFDPSNNEQSSNWPTIHVLDPHPVTEGVAEFGYYSGLCLEVSEPSQSIARGDEDAYSYMCPVAPTAIAVYEDIGRAVFYGDTTPLYWTYYPEELDEEEIQLLFNMVNWLAGEPVVATEGVTWGALKSVYR